MSLRVALLGLLADVGPASGYDLAKHFEKSTNYVWSAKHSQIYPELRKMEADGVVGASEEGARGKRMYEITADGRHELRRWLLETEPAWNVRNEGALRLFLLPLLEPAEAVPLLRAEAATYDVRVRRLTETCAAAEEADDVVSGYQVRLGIGNYTALRDWATAVADDMEKRAAVGDTKAEG